MLAGVTPPSPWMGSTNTAAVRPLTIACAALSRSRYVAVTLPGMMGANGVLYWTCRVVISRLGSVHRILTHGAKPFSVTLTIQWVRDPPSESQ